MRVLHLASFQGNIGDGANHAGFRSCFREAAGGPVEFTPFEIRQTYWGEKTFDRDFVEAAAAHDLVVVGGGNFFELWVEKSRTGVTFDAPPEILRKIRPPIVFNALGCDRHKGYTAETLARFRAFLDYVLSERPSAVSVRNDGSLATVDELLGSAYARRIESIADCGLFVDLPPREPSEPAIVINVASDMPELRYDAHGATGEVVTARGAMIELASAVSDLLDAHGELVAVFVPHIFSDLDAIAEVLRHIPDRLRRRRVRVAAYSTSIDGYVDAFSIYRSARLVLAMRFHATVCAIGLGRPTICLKSYPKMADLLEELGLPEIGTDLYRPGSAGRILEMAAAMLPEADAIARRYGALRARLRERNVAYYRRALQGIAA